ncbi:hypothetical protein LSTR_LSTR005998 [Laodelphax striatellus]|uniref:Zinc-hook domain-containing protein n=1 Tax=Laodelphax striatellus TaxID=195883 RepID=A0A482XQ11_LAOST|nr:hypothetical protein LSTR_LSTR005998 [Laodelphax striatellus]
MSRLDRLQISGIRSFGPESEDVGEIKFQAPLTLILGQNGCGKTTIIESLKFALCSEQPPNSRTGKGGSAFVHDPKLGNSTETLAQIKLRIFNIHNEPVVVCRSMKNIQKLKNMEFKKVDQTISLNNEMISNRCVDVDEQMCYFMGVSKPILNYVIFCHQEESCWPMEEGKKVKERFDHIFDADKYNKCLEKIRTLRSERVNANRLLGKDVDYSKANLDTALHYKEKLEGEQARLVSSENTIEACTSQLSKVEDELKVVKRKEMNIAELIAEKTADTRILQSLKKSIDEIVEGLPMGEFAGGDDELEDAIKSFNLDFEDKKKKLQEIEDQIKNVDASEKLMQSKLSTQQVKLGKLKRDQDAYKEMVQQRNDAFNKLALSLGMSDSGTLTPSSHTSFDTSMEEVESNIREVKGNFENLRSEADSKEKSLQDNIDGIRKEQAKLEQTKKLKSDQLIKTKSDLRKLIADLDEVGQSSKNLTALDNRLKRVIAEIKAESEGMDVSALDTEIKTLQTNITGIEDEIQEVNKEIDDLIEVSNLQTSLDSCVERKSAIDAQVEKLRSKTHDILKHLLKEIPEKNVKSNLDLCLSKLTHNIASTQKRISEKQTELTKLESKKHHLEEKLRTSRQTLISSEEELQSICFDKDYEKVVLETSEALKSVQDDTGTLKSSMIMYRKYIEKLQVPRPCCPLCTRQFNANQEAIELAKSLESKLKELPTRLASVTEEQNKLDEKLCRLQQLRPVFKRVNLLNETEIPELSDQLSAVSKEIRELSEEIASMEGDLEIGLKQDENLAKDIQVDVITLDQKILEARNIEKEIENLKAQIPSTGSNLPQARSKREELQAKLELARKSVESMQTKKTNHVDKINKLTTDQNEIVKEQLKVEKGVQQMKQLLDKKNELKELETSLADQIEKLSNEEFPIKQTVQRRVSNQTEVRNR